MIHYITSKVNPRIKELLLLKDPKVRKEKKLFLVEGFHLLEMALAANQVSMVITERVIDSLPDQMEQLVVHSDIIKKLSSQVTPQGVIAVCNMVEQKLLENERILYLDQVSDPGNIGTILRTAVSFGFQNVVFSPKCCSPYNEKVIHASQGAIFCLRILEEQDISFIKQKKEEGYQCIVTSLYHARSFEEVTYQEKMILVLGNEAHGVSEEVIDLASERVIIPIQKMESLNVAIAGGILFYEMDRALKKVK